MVEHVDTRVTLSLHPLNVEKIDGFDDETRPYVAATQTAFSEAYEGLRAVHDAKAAAKRNPTWNEAQQIIATDDYGQKVFQRIARGFDSARANLDKSIKALDEQLTAPVVSKAAHSVSAEIRAHVKGLSTGDRIAFIQRAIADGDDITASAVLGGPAYLSGIDRDMQAVMTRLYHERTSPAVAKRVRVMTAARELIETRGGLLFAEMEKAVGEKPHKIAALRAAKTAAEQAFVLKQP